MCRHLAVFFCTAALAVSVEAGIQFPGPEWEHRTPAETGVDGASLDTLAGRLGGRGCVIKDGYVIKDWGDQTRIGDWASAAKPVLSTLLFFAIEEGLVTSVDQPVADFGWALQPRHRGITFRQLGAMTSGYARPEGAGEAWAYNDFAIQLYQKTLFEKIFKQQSKEAAEQRLAALGLQDGLRFTERNRLSASVRDYARIVWFWTQKGQWDGRQVLPRRYFNEYMRPQTPKDIPLSQETGEDDDYLAIGSYGGGSNHFSNAGPGIYGSNWWFNDTGRFHPEEMTWPDAPPDTVMAMGVRGNCAAFIPSLNAALICADGKWGDIEGGNRDARLNQILGLFARANGYTPLDSSAPSHAKWSRVVLDFEGPAANAADSDPNPFLDYRMQVRFTGPGGSEYDVPGFFDGDGAGGLEGSTWRVIFSPDAVGEWRYRVAFRKGAGLAVSLDPDEGEPAALDGTTGGFLVRPQTDAAQGFYRLGRLEYVGAHYLKLRDDGYWLKGGSNSPEDFLAYEGFVNTPYASHTYQTHVADWQPGDPDWDNGKGKGIIGALNYLASVNVNSIYFLPMNIGGDGKNAYPYLGPIDREGSAANDNLHFDLAKLRQWDLVFDHAQRKGIMLHFVLNEAEELNKEELDDGLLGVERKLYYRELVARFACFPALQWNLCEEYNIKHPLAPKLVKDFAEYLGNVDPYDHPITVHHADTVDKGWTPFLGDPRFTVTSFQTNDIGVVRPWREKSRAAGVPLVIGMDEFYPDYSSAKNADRQRREYLWPVYFSGGQVEFIRDEKFPTGDFRECEALWHYMSNARLFIMEHLPFWEMEPANELLTGAAVFQGKYNRIPGHVFAKPGECYAVYLPIAQPTGTLDLTDAAGEFIQRWYDPRAGVFAGNETTVTGGSLLRLGPAPEKPGRDWVVLITRAEPGDSPP